MSPTERKQHALLTPVLVKAISECTVYEILHQYRNEETTEAVPNEICFRDVAGTGRTYFPTYGQCLSYCNDINELRKEIK